MFAFRKREHCSTVGLSSHTFVAFRAAWWDVWRV